MPYRLKLEPDDNDTILVTSPDFPLVTYGATEEEARRNATDAAIALLQSMIDHRQAIPAPGRGVRPGDPLLRLPLHVAMKVKLYIELIAAGLTRADLQRRLGWQRESVDRLFRLDHQSKLEQIDAAFGALGKVVDLSVRDRDIEVPIAPA